MSLDGLETGARWAGGVLAAVSLAYLYLGLGRGLRRPVTSSGRAMERWLRSPLFYVLASLGFFGLCAMIWEPLPVKLSITGRSLALVLGGLLLFPGLGLVLWGRQALGRFYAASTSMSAPLYTNHRLITSGPYAFVRHPVYLGMFLAALGGVLVYQTWTLVFLLVCSLGLLLRVRREEQALAARFGEAWQVYARRVPAFVPRLGRRI